MREHLYRAKSLGSCEWVYGNYVETIEEYTKPSENHWVYAIIEKDVGGNRYMGEYSDLGWHKIDRNTLCEYTGLTDKNGNRIFEKDIVAVCDMGTGYSKRRIQAVEYDKGGYSFYRDYGDIHFVEVIGNIYDNTDLLSDKE